MLLPKPSHVVLLPRHRIVIKVKVLLECFELSVPVGVHRIANDNLVRVFRLRGHRIIQRALFVTLAQNGLKVKLLTIVGLSVLCDFGRSSEGASDFWDKAILQLEFGLVIRVIFSISDPFWV